MKKILSMLLVLVLMFSLVSVMATAASKVAGDVNGDGEINAKDVTILRRFLAGGYGIELYVPTTTSDLKPDETPRIPLP